MAGARIVVRGHVQGVGFRYAAVRAARALGLRGRARNLPDGTVEVLAFGDADDILRFRGVLRRDMPGRVDRVEVGEIGDRTPPDGFRIAH